MTLAAHFHAKRIMRRTLSGLTYRVHLKRSETGVMALVSRKQKERVFTAWRWVCPCCLRRVLRYMHEYGRQHELNTRQMDVLCPLTPTTSSAFSDELLLHCTLVPAVLPACPRPCSVEDLSS